jgi:hypothetical protein
MVSGFSLALLLVGALVLGASAQEHAYDAAGVLSPAAPAVADDDLPKCAQAKSCEACFIQQECYANPFGSQPICSPCGWCTNGTSSGKGLVDDVEGLCAMAPTGIVDFCPWVESATSHLYCPVTVCTVGDFGCSCAGNQCPAVKIIVEWLAGPVVYFIIFSILFTFMSCVALIVRLLCLRRARHLSNSNPIVVVPIGNLNPTHQQAVMGTLVTDTTQEYSKMS